MPSDPSTLGVAGRALLGALVACAVLALVEGVLALLDVPDPGVVEGDFAVLWWPRPDLDRAVPHPETGGTFRVRTDARGLRGRSPPEEGPWTLALGCSTTFGWGVEDDEAWPAVLGDLIGQPVINAGVPGWSSEQARRGAERWLSLKPSRVIVATIVRDATRAPRPDFEAQPTPWLWRTHLAALLRPASRAGSTPAGDSWRVPPDRFAENLAFLAAEAAPAEVLFLAFPQREPASAWISAMESVGPTLVPALEDDAFFEADPIHLDAGGHRALARWLAARPELGGGRARP